MRRADESPGRLGHRFPVCVTQGRLLIALDRLPEARSALSAGVRVSEELGVRWALATHRVYLAYERFAAGEWDDALAELEVSITVAEEVGETYSLVYAHGLLSRISLYRNDLYRAREAADAGVPGMRKRHPGMSPEKIAIAVASMWKAIGVQAKLTNQEWKVYLSTRDEKNFQIARAAWIGDYQRFWERGFERMEDRLGG